jgi:hypothetical protein
MWTFKSQINLNNLSFQFLLALFLQNLINLICNYEQKINQKVKLEKGKTRV